MIYSGNFSDYQFSLGASGTGLIVTDMRANGDGSDYLYDVDRLHICRQQMWSSDVKGTLEQPDFHANLITTPGFKGEISGQVNVFRDCAAEFIAVGSAFPFHNSYVVFDPSFSGKNVIELDPGHYTVALSGSNAVFASMASIGPTVVIPVGIEGVPIKMGENVWSL
ncbi:MAG: hypothetical protein R3D52_15225 [Xanthobacteraceae bacterium]